MELFLVIVIVGVAGAYIFKTFYNKFKTGKASGSSCGCSSCDAAESACNRPVDTGSDRYFN